MKEIYSEPVTMIADVISEGFMAASIWDQPMKVRVDEHVNVNLYNEQIEGSETFDLDL